MVKFHVESTVVNRLIFGRVQQTEVQVNSPRLHVDGHVALADPALLVIWRIHEVNGGVARRLGRVLVRGIGLPRDE